MAEYIEIEKVLKIIDNFAVASKAECKMCGEKTSKVISDLQEKLSKAKAEVAREIFEEIENLMSFNNAGLAIITVKKYEELKKKYTE